MAMLNNQMASATLKTPFDPQTACRLLMLAALSSQCILDVTRFKKEPRWDASSYVKTHSLLSYKPRRSRWFKRWCLLWAKGLIVAG